LQYWVLGELYTARGVLAPKVTHDYRLAYHCVAHDAVAVKVIDIGKRTHAIILSTHGGVHCPIASRDFVSQPAHSAAVRKGNESARTRARTLNFIVAD